MTCHQNICYYTSRSERRNRLETLPRRWSWVLIACLALFATYANAQKMFRIEKDSIPMFRGFAVSVDLVGPAMLAMGDYGEYEAALRLNLHDQYFPVVELGYGKADHDDEVTEQQYKTSAPYFRIGCDLNLLKNKHADNRFYGGVRFAMTSYDVDIARPGLVDPVWTGDASYSIVGESCSMSWLEVVFGLDAKIWGPLHLGWNVRYKRRLSHNDGVAGNTWYVPGYGKNGDTRLGANFMVIIDI